MKPALILPNTLCNLVKVEHKPIDMPPRMGWWCRTEARRGVYGCALFSFVAHSHLACCLICLSPHLLTASHIASFVHV